MILVGQYDSPFVRRVAVSLRVLGFAYDHDTRSVFADFDAMRQVNPLVRIPSLVLDDGETLIDSAAILDWIDQTVGPERALVPATGPERRGRRQFAAETGMGIFGRHQLNISPTGDATARRSGAEMIQLRLRALQGAEARRSQREEDVQID